MAGVVAAWQPVRELADRLAPWPGREADATAEAMTRYALVQAQAAYAAVWALPGGPPGSPGDREHHHAVHAFVDRWMVAALFRALAEAGGADETAGSIWAEVEAGESMGEWLWEWLDAAGIDPDEVRRAVERAVKAEREGSPA
jgi:hypothetical protein